MAMDKGTKLEVAMNMPVRGTIKSVFYAKSKNADYADNVQIIGNFSQATPDDAGGVTYLDRGVSHFYIALGAIEAFEQAGVVQTLAGQTDQFGHQKYKLMHSGPVEILRKEVTENGKKKGQTTVWRLDASGKRIPNVAPAPLTTAPAAAGAGGQTTGPAAGPGAPAPAAPPPTAPAKLTVQQVRYQWALLDEAVTAASSIAVKALTGALGCEANDLDQAAVASLTATVLIRAEHYALPVTRGMTKNGDKDEPSGKSGAGGAAHAPPARSVPAETRSPAPATAAVAGQRDLGDFPDALEDEEEDDLPF
jgi:hypothetical protein